jgi:hypothetical protein
MKIYPFALLLCIAVPLWGQTSATPPDNPSPQTEQQQQNERRPQRRGVTSFWPAVSAANSAGKLTPGEKFRLFGFNTFNPFPIASAAAQAGLSQAFDSPEGFGQGAEGYGKRFGAAYANTATSQFFGTFFFPTILKQDPRYFRRGEGSGGSRIGYAVTRVFITRNDSGSHAPNVSFLLAAGSSAAISNLYYPAGSRNFGDAAIRFGTDYGVQAGFNVFKEFWPDMKRKLFKKK